MAELPITLLEAEREEPVIGEVTAVQDSVNTSVANLSGEATEIRCIMVN